MFATRQRSTEYPAFIGNEHRTSSLLQYVRRMMKSVITRILFCAPMCLIGLQAAAEEQTPAPESTASSPPASPASPVLMPAMSGPLSANANPTGFDLPLLGKVHVTGAFSAFGQSQNNVLPGDRSNQVDISNAQIFINKASGLVQFFAQAGLYSIPALGVPYIRARDATTDFFGPFPQGFLKLAPTDSFSILAGRLPTLIGAEYTFSFENMNIQRGLLWNQENAVNRGVQVNYTTGPLAMAFAWHDGFYSNTYSWATLSAAYTIDDANSLSVIAGGNTRHTSASTIATPLFQNNEQIYNVIYTHTAGPWTLQPYLQYTHVPSLPEFGTTQAASTFGVALLMNYKFGADSVPADWRVPGFSLPVRLEYISSTGSAAEGAPNLLYGPGSKAWSITVTPTYQYRVFFVRTELSFVQTWKATPGLAFGPSGNDRSQVRGLIEVGMLL